MTAWLQQGPNLKFQAKDSRRRPSQQYQPPAGTGFSCGVPILWPCEDLWGGGAVVSEDLLLTVLDTCLSWHVIGHRRVPDRALWSSQQGEWWQSKAPAQCAAFSDEQVTGTHVPGTHRGVGYVVRVDIQRHRMAWMPLCPHLPVHTHIYIYLILFVL